MRRVRLFEVVLFALAVLSLPSCRNEEAEEEEDYTEEEPTPDMTTMETDMSTGTTDMGTTDMGTTDMGTGTDMSPPGQGAMLWNDGAGEHPAESWLSWVSAQGPSPRILLALLTEEPRLD